MQVELMAKKVEGRKLKKKRGQNNLKINCANCNKEIIIYLSRIGKTKFCSRECSKYQDHVSWNKGKRLHYEVWNKGTKGLTKANKTSFKKGLIPKNYNGGLSFYSGRWTIVCRNDKKYAYARAVMSCHLKRPLKSSEIVHHINEDTTDDRLENLQIVTRAEHIKIHRKQLLEARKWHFEQKNQK